MHFETMKLTKKFVDDNDYFSIGSHFSLDHWWLLLAASIIGGLYRQFDLLKTVNDPKLVSPLP